MQNLNGILKALILSAGDFDIKQKNVICTDESF